MSELESMWKATKDKTPFEKKAEDLRAARTPEHAVKKQRKVGSSTKPKKVAAKRKLEIATDSKGRTSGEQVNRLFKSLSEKQPGAIEEFAGFVIESSSATGFVV